MSEEKQLMTASEVAKMLNIGVESVRAWTRDGKIPYYRVVGSLRFDRDELMEWLEDSKNMMVSK